MKGKFWKGILVLAVMVFLLGCPPPNTKEEKATDIEAQKRIELLKQNKWFNLRAEDVIIDGNEVDLNYELSLDSTYKYSELVNVFIWFPKSSDVPTQSYYIYGKGNKVLIVEWHNVSDNRNIKVFVQGMKTDSDLPYVAVERIVDRGIFYYSTVQKYFKVDTCEGLAKVIEEEKKKLAEEAQKIIK